MEIGIIGCGGVGGYFGAKLARAGNNVTFVARGEHLNAIRANGLYIKSIDGDFKIEPANITDNPRLLSGCELIILGIKAWQVKEIGSQLSKIINTKAIVLPLQNGVLAAEELSMYIPQYHIIGGLCKIFSKIESPGVINHMGLVPTIIFGELDNSLGDRVQNIKEVFDDAGINNQVSNYIQSDLWKKFILICLSGLGAITRAGYGLLREMPETRQIMIEILEEICQIANNKKVTIGKDIIEQSMKYVDTYPYDSMSSLARDVINGKPSEIEYQNGTVVKYGQELEIPTPANRFVYSMIKAMEKGNR
jgi:2-dehydropantoate 2-reductase